MTSDDAGAIALSAALLGFYLYGVAMIVLVVRPMSRLAKRVPKPYSTKPRPGVQTVTRVSIGTILAVGSQAFVIVLLFRPLTTSAPPVITGAQSAIFALELIAAVALAWRTVTDWARS